LRCRPFRSSFTAAPELSQEQPLPAPEQQTQAPPLGPEDGLYEQQGSLFDDKAAGLPRDHGFNGARRTPEFTERQYAVLVCLCRGDPNKVIGRKLGMTETTVKVHVREIMRKLGVSNRTQVAIAAAHVCVEAAVELVPADSTLAIKPSISH
jgi:DNA-binding CsgD family transcriptional regulator